MAVERVGVAFEPELLRRFDDLIRAKGYASRSEALRDLARRAIIESETAQGDAIVIGTLTILYDHEVRGIMSRLLELQHHHHSEVLSTMHIHVSERACLEVLVVRGRSNRVRALADRIRALKGVKHGELVLTRG
ncbi:MAG: nickel-responsive transcriptional regulator NikR [Thermoplasmatota archaeon]